MYIGEPKPLSQWNDEFNHWVKKPNKKLNVRQLANRFKIIRMTNRFEVYYNPYYKLYKFDKKGDKDGIVTDMD